MSKTQDTVIAQLMSNTHPAMRAALDEMVTAYIAMRQGMTVEQVRAAIETDPQVRASHARKVARAAIALSTKGAGFTLHISKQPEQAAPSTGTSPELQAIGNAILASAMGKKD